jgi:hypothetical protein
MGKSRRSKRDLASINTGSLAGPLSARSFLSILSFGSVLSIGSAGSILSIGSAGSIPSIGSAGSILSIGGAGSSPSTDREEPEPEEGVLSRPSPREGGSRARLLGGAKIGTRSHATLGPENRNCLR